ncbi:ROK family protein [Planifilum fimeticola]|jgi:glucokinase-like ROK family protein
MPVTGDQSLIKKINQSIVLEMIRNHCPISRAQIAELTGLTKGTVSTIVNDLMKDNLVYEIGPGRSSGGRRPVMLMFNKAAGYSIGVDLGVNYLLTVLTDLQGNIVLEQTSLYQDLSYDEILSLLKKDLRTVIDQAPSSTYGIIGIGIGIPGIVGNDGTVLFTPNLGWKDVDLKGVINNEFQVPVWIDNEANTGALGEKLYGAGREASDLVYVSVGIGIGTGIVLNGELYKGISGFSGEIGHTTIEVNGKKCRCGNKGCWELYASEHALLSQAKSLPMFRGGDNREIDLESLIRLADEGHTEVINLFNQIGEYLGIGIMNIALSFNPELVIIGNRLSKAQQWIVNPVKKVLSNRLMPYHREKLRVEFSNLGVYSSALGASSLAISNFFSDSKVTLE